MRTHHYYSPLTSVQLRQLIDVHRAEFQQLLGDTFSEAELEAQDPLLEELATLEAQPLLEELAFEDLVADPATEETQRSFFNRCQSILCVENLPYLENNPFQVSYLLQLLKRFDELLIDQGGMSELTFKDALLSELVPLKGMDQLVARTKALEARPAPRAQGPMDKLVEDVYRELDRLSARTLPMEDASEKLLKLYHATLGRPSAEELFILSGLNPKDFGDNLERLKFFLKRQPE